MRYEILLLLPTDELNQQMEQIIKKQTGIKCHITQSTDTYNLPDLLCECQPELVLVSPVIICDQFIPLLKKRTGLADTKFVAYCITVLDKMFQKNFDAMIDINSSPSELEEVITELLAIDTERDEDQTLTPREREVVIAVVKGCTNKEIAEKLFLSPHTVITHRRNIARKLNIHSPSGLTIYAIINKLVELDEIAK